MNLHRNHLCLFYSFDQNIRSVFVYKIAHMFDFCKWLFFPKKGLQNNAFRC